MEFYILKCWVLCMMHGRMVYIHLFSTKLACWYWVICCYDQVKQKENLLDWYVRKMISKFIRQNLSLQDCRKHWRKTLQRGTFWQNDFQLESRPRAPVANSRWDSKRLICFSFLNLEELLNRGNSGLNFQFSSNRAQTTLSTFL